MIEHQLEFKFTRVEKHLIGLWRFRKMGSRRSWCATFEYNGYYYDVEGFETPSKTLDMVHYELEKLKQKQINNAD